MLYIMSIHYSCNALANLVPLRAGHGLDSTVRAPGGWLDCQVPPLLSYHLLFTPHLSSPVLSPPLATSVWPLVLAYAPGSAAECPRSLEAGIPMTVRPSRPGGSGGDRGGVGLGVYSLLLTSEKVGGGGLSVSLCMVYLLNITPLMWYLAAIEFDLWSCCKAVH